MKNKKTILGRSIIPTELQKRGAREWANEIITAKRPIKGRALIRAGYDKNSAHNANKIMNGEGFKKELNAIYENAGLTEELLVESLVYDIKGKPLNRLGELKLGTDLKGMTKKEVDLNIELLETTDILKGIIDDKEEEKE